MTLKLADQRGVNSRGRRRSRSGGRSGCHGVSIGVGIGICVSVSGSALGGSSHSLAVGDLGKDDCACVGGVAGGTVGVLDGDSLGGVDLDGIVLHVRGLPSDLDLCGVGSSIEATEPDPAISELLRE